MSNTAPQKPVKTKKTEQCAIPQALPKEQLHKLMFRQSEEEAQAIRDYVEWQARKDNEKVLHAEKVASERVMGRDYDVWDVHTDGQEGRWWVITSPTNLYSQRLMPSMDYVLSFHIGLMMRVAAQREPTGSEAEQELLLVTSRKLVQAAEALDAADESEDFQAVGMQCRECLLAFVREVTEDGQFDEGNGEQPKKSDFKAWSDRIAGIVAAGGSAERVRSYLKKTADETWQLTNWLTHASNATRSDASLAVAATENVIGSFVSMVLRSKIAAPERCGRCKSYRLVVDWRPDIGPVGAYVLRCEACGAEALREEDTQSAVSAAPDEA